MPISESQYTELKSICLDLKANIDAVLEKQSQFSSLIEKRVIADKKKGVLLSEAAEILEKTYETILRYVKNGRLEVVEGSHPLKVTMRSVNNFK